jgi:hypothetical protein
VKGGNGLIAADLIFSDGLEATNSAAAQIEAALNEELHARQLGVRGVRKQQLAILGATAGGVLLVMIVLAFTGGAPTQAEEPVIEKRPEPSEVRPQPQPVASPASRRHRRIC